LYFLAITGAAAIPRSLTITTRAFKDLLQYGTCIRRPKRLVTESVTPKKTAANPWLKSLTT
jgi:hypothetical protein